MANVIRPEIAAMSAYLVQDAAGLVKLDAMENPFDFPSGLRGQLAARLADASINRYPDPRAHDLKTALRKAMAIPADMDVLLGNGSDEIIQMIALAVARPGATILSVEPSFVMFKMITTFCGMHYIGVPLTADFEIDADETLAAIQKHQPAVIFLAYPNNPTGNLFDRDAIRAIIRATAGLVVIDEAYFAFSSRSFLDELRRYQNVVLMRTVSKLGLAGLRLGMLIGTKTWLDAFDKVRLPYNINVLTQVAATFALDNMAHFTMQTELLIAQRDGLVAALANILLDYPSAKLYPSEANFILVRMPTATGRSIFEHLCTQRVLVKNTGAGHPLLHDTLRITIGAPSENEILIDALKNALQSALPDVIARPSN